MLHTMRRLARLGEGDLQEVIDALQEIRRRLFRGEALRIVVTCEESMTEPLQQLLGGLVGQLPSDGAGGGPYRAAPREPCAGGPPAPRPVALNAPGFPTARVAPVR